MNGVCACARGDWEASLCPPLRTPWEAAVCTPGTGQPHLDGGGAASYAAEMNACCFGRPVTTDLAD